LVACDEWLVVCQAFRPELEVVGEHAAATAAKRIPQCVWDDEKATKKRSDGAGRLGALLAQIAKMPGPKKTFEKNDQASRENAEADPRRSVTQTISGTGEQNESQIAEPSEGYERPDHQ
jgi:hypothetical protein